MIRVPRVWDSPERRTAEADSHREFTRLARTFKTALDDWTEKHYWHLQRGFGTRRRLLAKPIEPWFDDECEDDDGGPETRH
jgi:hypothetical protein